jgi:hypothetical protein
MLDEDQKQKTLFDRPDTGRARLGTTVRLGRQRQKRSNAIRQEFSLKTSQQKET